ncbi:hypothetical protein BD779DRAFT_1791581 [Infundibulicybe gibba]|nr:hypothetical protein BD779DRAFT_1791581 [Infundibulicybe gibba]
MAPRKVKNGGPTLNKGVTSTRTNFLRLFAILAAKPQLYHEYIMEWEQDTGHISHQDKISVTRQARHAHPQAHTMALDRINTHDNGQDQLAAPHIYDARPSHSYRTLSQLSTYGIAPQHGSARTQYFLTRDPNAPRPTPTATRTNITARASMRPGHLDNVPIR